ncbi:2-oxoglutarate and iron-dependent oxygenase domain-containing protein 1 [Macaca fascicularis]|uniref:Prolyl 3-hydroxylase OGFOD1 n=1 Tax=Macaca fascicularis TaxID=9541 RepID=G7Q157_MACFA|nr:2-oxoglutarate and iron-dependent oxygenase domain-containing protein 1 [Macaca fascicularis]
MNGKRPAEPGPARVGKKGKKEVMAEFSDAVMEETLKKQVAEAWSRRTPFSHEVIVMDMDPFLHCVIPNFIQSQDFLEGLQKELMNLDFHEKYNDLYKFQQHGESDNVFPRYTDFYGSHGLASSWMSTEFLIRVVCTVSNSSPVSLWKILFEDFRSWLSDISKIDLESTIDMSCAKYEFTDALLCHDDELEGRRIAFILYLVPPWDRSLGGTLDLYSIDEHFQPKQIVKSLIPSWNKLIFFEVSPVSFHQVSEVLSEEKSRLSISGWFHGPSLTRPPNYFEPPIPRSPHIPQDPEKFAKVCEALEHGDVEWSSRGPPNKRFYEKAEESKLPEILKECMKLFRSEALFLLLSNFTGLKLHFLAPSEEEMNDKKEEEAADSTEEGTSHSPPEPENNQTAISNNSQQNNDQTDPEPEENETKKESSVPTCQGELRRWKTGHYTLIHDHSKAEFALDLILYCGCEAANSESRKQFFGIGLQR